MNIYLNIYFAMLASFAAVVLLASTRVPLLGALAIPLCWPSFFVLGVDETTERYGVTGELTLTWLSSLPWIWLCSLVISHWNRRKVMHSSSGKPNFQ